MGWRLGVTPPFVHAVFGGPNNLTGRTPSFSQRTPTVLAKCGVFEMLIFEVESGWGKGPEGM